jgi:O-antigen ligase
VTHAFALPTLSFNQTLERVPLTPWSAACFLLIVLAAAYLGARRSPWVVLVLALTIPFAGYRDIGQTTLTIPKCVTFGSALGLVLSGINPWPRSPGARRLLVMGAILLIPIAASSVSAVDPWLVAREFFKQAEYVVLFWCAVASFENIRESPRYLAWGVSVATGVVATFALVQAFSGGAPSAVLVNGHPLPRVAGTLEGPNQLAGFLEAAAPALWVSPLLGIGGLPLRTYDVSASWAALILSQSRAGIIMSAISYALLFRIRRAAARAWAPASAVGIGAGLVVLVVWLVFWAHASWADLERFLLLDVTTDAGGVGTRAQLWPAAIELFRQHPLLGVGAGNFSVMLPSAGVYGVASGASSLWLQTLAEQGIVGFAALATFAWMALRETYRLRTQSVLAVAAFLAALSLLTHQLVDNLFFFPKVAGLFWLLLGSGTAAPNSRSADGMQGSTAR